MDFEILTPETLGVLKGFTPLIIGIGIFFLGEIVILSGFVLASQGLIDVTTMFTAALVATLLADFFWFFIGKSLPRIHRLKIFLTFKGLYKKHEDFFTTHPALVLFCVKYVYGLRWSTIIYYTSTPMTWKKYVTLDFFSTTSYVITLSIIGYITGKGIYNLVDAYHTLLLVFFAIFAGLLLALFIRIVGKIIFKKITQTS